MGSRPVDLAVNEDRFLLSLITIAARWGTWFVLKAGEASLATSGFA